MNNYGIKYGVFCWAVLLALTGCAGVKTEAKYPERQAGDSDIVYRGERQGIFGPSGHLFDSTKSKNQATGITVNAYLWRAALDTISFMPITSADPFGGMILTDWYSDPSVPGERVKANIMILSRDLRSDGLKITLFRQVAENDRWVPAPVDPKTVSQLEDTILNRARELKVAAGEK